MRIKQHWHISAIFLRKVEVSSGLLLYLKSCKLPLFSKARINKKLTLLWWQLSYLLLIHVNVVSAVEELLEEKSMRPLRPFLRKTIDALHSGATVSKAFHQKGYFKDDVLIALLRSGERTGALTHTFGQMALYCEWREGAAHQFMSGLLYPIFILVSLFALLGSLIFYLIPSFSSLMAGSGMDLPFFIALLEAFSNHLKARGIYYVWTILLVVGTLIIAFRGCARVRAEGHRLLFHLPFIGAYLQKREWVRFTRLMGLMVGVCLSIPESIALCWDTSSNMHIRYLLGTVWSEIQGGRALSEALHHTHFYPIRMVGFIKAGEQTSSLISIFKHLTTLYEHELKRSTDSFIRFVPPALILLMAGVLIVVVMGVIYPFYESVVSLERY